MAGYHIKGASRFTDEGEQDSSGVYQGPMFVANVSPFSSTIGLSDQPYDPGIGPQVDHAIRYLPDVARHCYTKARQLMFAAGDNNFEIVQQNKPEMGSRPRSYVVPKNAQGIHDELANAVLLKAAMGMAGK